MTRYGMVLDTTRCVRCYACTIACKAENDTPAGIHWQIVLEEEYGEYPDTQRRFLPRPCMNCENPPCVDVCPTGASYQREDGIILIDYEKCIGCKYCMAACPYESRQYIDKIEGYFPEIGYTALEAEGYKKFKTNTVTKCTFCVDRIDTGLARGLKPGVDRDATPACVITCPAKARIFGDLDDPNSEVSQAARNASPLLEEQDTVPKVFYAGAVTPDILTSLRKNAQFLSTMGLTGFKNILSPVAALAVGAVAAVALVNAAKKGPEEKENKEEVSE